MRELKLLHHDLLKCMRRRTPPGVRELKRFRYFGCGEYGRRTPPGVRELKPCLPDDRLGHLQVAPLPGCVN